MLTVEAPTLQRRYRRAILRLEGWPLLNASVENAGRWLRHHHCAAPLAAAHTRDVDPAQVADLARRLATFCLSQGTAHEVAVRRTADVIAQAAAGALTNAEVVGLHGDYGLPNVFAEPGGKVIGYDMTGLWRAPCLEDVAYFLLSLHTAQVVALTRGIAPSPRERLRCEEAFLGGYFQHARTPEQSLAVFRLLVLLDRWAARLVQPATKRAAAVRRRLFDDWMALHAHDLLAVLDR